MATGLTAMIMDFQTSTYREIMTWQQLDHARQIYGEQALPSQKPVRPTANPIPNRLLSSLEVTTQNPLLSGYREV